METEYWEKLFLQNSGGIFEAKKSQNESGMGFFKAYDGCCFILSPNDSLSEAMKNAFWFINKALCILEILNIFGFPCSPIFFPVGHFFRG